MENHRSNEKNQPKKPQESFPQNFSFAEKILDPDGMFSSLSDDYDIRKVTREKVENILYANQLISDHVGTEETDRLGPQGINQWLWENKVLREISPSTLQDYLKTCIYNAPHVFIRRLKMTRSLLQLVAKVQRIPVAQVQNHHVLDPSSIRYATEHLAIRYSKSLFQFLLKLSIHNGYINEKIPPLHSTSKQEPFHPRILNYKSHMESKGFSPKHIRNSITHVQQCFHWLCSNVQEFQGKSPAEISVFHIQNKHLLMYRTYKRKMVKDRVCSPITFTHCIYAIRSFYYFLNERFGYEPPLYRFESITVERYHPRDIPTRDQIDSFLQVVNRYAKEPKLEQLGYRFMIELGLRLSEVAKIKWKDINLATHNIVIHSKGKKTHILPLAGKLYELVQECHNNAKTTYLFGKSVRTIENQFYEYYKLYAMMAGWSFPGGVHLFRHTFTTNLAMKGILPQTIKELARVQMLNTVGLYIHMANQDTRLINQINLLSYE